MKKHLVTMHCGQEMPANSPAQRFCNRQCSGFFVSRRPGAKKRPGHSGVKQCVAIYPPDSNHPAWNSAKRYLNKRGYILLSFYDRDLKITFQRFEHIVVWEKVNGEQVPRGWVIHHLNEQKDDNDPCNLLALPRGLHRELHVELELLFAECRGLEYLKRRHQITKLYIDRSTELTNLRRDWYGE
jgi:hypothetical protein